MLLLKSKLKISISTPAFLLSCILDKYKKIVGMFIDMYNNFIVNSITQLKKYMK